MNPIQSLADLKGLTDVPIEALELPELNAIVYVRAFDAQAFAIFMSMYKPDGKFEMKDAAKIAALCMCDGNGQRIGQHDKLAEELMQHSASLVQSVYTKALELSGLTTKSVEEAEKKSEASHT